MAHTKAYQQKIYEIKELLAKQKIQSATNLLHELHIAKPRDSKVLTLLGVAAYKQDDYEDAKQYWLDAIKINPKNWEAHCQLAHLYLNLEQFDKAIHEYQKIPVSALDVESMMNLAFAFERSECYWQAAQMFERLVIISPSIEGYLHHGHMLRLCGKLTEAELALKKGAELSPRSIALLLELSQLYIQTNQQTLAKEALKKILMIDPLNIQALFLLTRLPSDMAHIKETKRIQEILYNEDLSDSDKALLHYGLGRIYDDNNFYERAYYHYLQANRYNARVDSLELSQFLKQLEDIKKRFKREIIAEHQLTTHFKKKPIFIIGMSTSGKSLVEKLLIQHPQVATLGRQALFEHALKEQIEIDKIGAAHTKLKFSETALQAVANKYYAQLESMKSDAVYYCEIEPMNYMYLGLIAMIFPNARIIYCTREPIDLCLRNFFHYYGYSHGYAYDLTSTAKYYNAYTGMVSYWRSLGIPMLEVSYEKLLQSPQETMNEVFSYVGLSPVHSLQIPKLSHHEVGRWRKYLPYVQVVVDLVYGKK